MESLKTAGCSGNPNLLDPFSVASHDFNQAIVFDQHAKWQQVLCYSSSVLMFQLEINAAWIYAYKDINTLDQAKLSK